MGIPDPEIFEKLGTFYLGKLYDLAAGELEDELYLYDAKDLCTHALCVGMTGSGKTGLCVSLLEEAALDGIPALAIDPKGDLGNLLLTFPDLAAADFAPWIEPREAQRHGRSIEEQAAAQAELWRRGLESWGEGPERIRRLREAAEVTIYTPGSDAGVPVSVLASFAAPPPQVAAEADLLRERIHSLTTSLLDLLGIDADPVKSREYILIASLLDHLWREGRDLDLPALIQAVQSPPMERIGVLGLEAFFPAKDRFGLAMALNNLLAAPTFQAWSRGEPLDVDRFLYTAEGRPRISIFSIAHLSDAERMFFVSLLLNQTVGWMRTRPGTASLRALLYMDEIFGFLPPVAEPPSKRPLLTLLKQARAFGLGVVLATQNPVDLDYKALSNMGTWFLGRLQTERDKLRVLDGLEGAAAGGAFDRGRMEQILAGLSKRVFLAHNVHEDEPVIFHTRWAMSYLKGPLTRLEIQRLSAGREVAEAPPVAAPVPASAAAAPAPSPAPTPSPVGPAPRPRPVLPPEVTEIFLPLGGGADSVLYRPSLIGLARVHFVDRRRDVETTEEMALLYPLEGERVDWGEATEIELAEEDLTGEPPAAGEYAPLPAPAADPRSFRDWHDQLADHLYRSRRFELWHSPTLDAISQPGESERDFRIRLGDLARERRDLEIGELRERYAAKLARLEERQRRAEHKIEREAEQAREQKMSTMVSVGATLLSAFLGGKRMGSGTVGRASTALKSFGRGAKERQDVERAREDLAALEEQERELNAELEAEIAELEERFDPLAEKLETVTLKPRRTDIDIRLLALGWEGRRR